MTMMAQGNGRPLVGECVGAPLPTPQPLLAAPGYLARRLYQAYVAIWARQVDATLTGPQFAVLVAVREYPGADQGSLASAVALDRSTMADIARRLEEKGLITRTPDPSDGRRRLLHLTSPGQDVLLACDRRARQLDEQLLAGLDEEERALVMRMLEELSDRWVALASE
jgi:DNA-binding MarR family transcriptional regulator